MRNVSLGMFHQTISISNSISLATHLVQSKDFLKVTFDVDL